MIQKVYKYGLRLMDLSCIRMPKNAKILTVGVQGGDVFLWALICPSEIETEERTFRIAGTGHEISNGKFEFIGTVFLHGDQLVLHVFEAI